MNDNQVEQQLRHFLIWVVGFIFIGTVIELLLLEHYVETPQFIPYILCGFGLISLVIARLKSTHQTIIMLRWVMAAVALGGLLGIFFHFKGNMAFAREINPTFSFGEALWPAIKGGNPALAPGILFLAGILGIAITYKHPSVATTKKI